MSHYVKCAQVGWGICIIVEQFFLYYITLIRLNSANQLAGKGVNLPVSRFFTVRIIDHNIVIKQVKFNPCIIFMNYLRLARQHIVKVYSIITRIIHSSVNDKITTNLKGTKLFIIQYR